MIHKILSAADSRSHSDRRPRLRIVGLGMGYLTLRFAEAFFSIATLALAVVLQTLIVNWTFVGGLARRLHHPPGNGAVDGNYIEYLFLVMLALAIIAITTARIIERSQLGDGFCDDPRRRGGGGSVGVPTLRLKLIATTISGALMGMAGAPFPYYIGYVEPTSTFGLAVCRQLDRDADDRRHDKLDWTVDRRHFARTIQQVATVTISSAVIF